MFHNVTNHILTDAALGTSESSLPMIRRWPEHCGVTNCDVEIEPQSSMFRADRNRPTKHWTHGRLIDRRFGILWPGGRRTFFRELTWKAAFGNNFIDQR